MIKLPINQVLGKRRNRNIFPALDSSASPYYFDVMSESQKHLDNKVVILNGFSNEEIVKIMGEVKKLFDNPKELIFAKTTERSVQMKLTDLIEDISADHAYLQANPPNINKKSE